MSGNRFNFYALKQAARLGMIAFSLLALLAACGKGSSTTPPVAGATATATSSGNIGGGPSTPVPVPTPTGPTATVSMITPGGYTFSFNPVTLNISVGTTVIWTNRTTTPHTITSDTGMFNSGLNDPIEAGFTFTYKFTKPGTYKYHCALHPTMTATIIVT
ncbi:MAG TPA: plastocyanin/azurin family copper-binding protein [Ktedonosporobacter sp.]|jgi:plastocyanin|nr:plastocyanin/azurin family copper-binding protein [Ktedonosporobacter sp.]